MCNRWCYTIDTYQIEYLRISAFGWQSAAWLHELANGPVTEDLPASWGSDAMRCWAERCTPGSQGCLGPCEVYNSAHCTVGGHVTYDQRLPKRKKTNTHICLSDRLNPCCPALPCCLISGCRPSIQKRPFDREFRQFHQFRSRSTINSVNPELLDDPVRILGRPQARG